MLRFCHARGSSFDSMRENLAKSPLYQFGDALLVWVNEGDFWGLNPIPTDVVAADEQRKREDAILLQAEEIRSRRSSGEAAL